MLAHLFENDDGYGYLHYIDGPDKTERYHLRWDGNNRWKDENNGQALKVRYRGASFDVIAITTRNDFETNFVNDAEFGSYPYGDQVFMFGNDGVSQEIRFSSPEKSSSPWHWLIGGYAFTDENEALAEFYGQSRATEFDSDGMAVFGQITRSFYERLRLTGGLRLDHQSSEGAQYNNQVAGPYSNDLEHTEWLPKVSVDYDLTKAVMTYASISKGILAGGYNYAFASDSDSLVFDPEKTWNYEIGLKSSWLDNRMICNMALYYIDISDKQVEEYISGPMVRSITNAAQAYSRGSELDIRFRLAPGFTLFGAAGYNEARIDEWLSHESDGTRFDYHNKRLPFAPTFTYNVGLDYTHGSGFFLRADLVGVGDFYSDSKNDQKIDGYETVNVHVGYQWESVEAVLYAKNLLDEEYYTNRSVYLAGTSIAEEGAPRTIGLRLTWRY